MEKIERLVHQRKTSMKVRFMMMVVTKLYNNGWKKTGELSEPLMTTIGYVLEILLTNALVRLIF